MSITPELVFRLRKETGCGMYECKEALQLAEGDMEVAFEFLYQINNAVMRYKIINDQKVPFTKEDYFNYSKDKVLTRRENLRDSCYDILGCKTQCEGNYEEEPDWIDANVEDVTLDGEPLDGNYLDRLIESIEE